MTNDPSGSSIAVELQRYPAVVWRRRWWVVGTAAVCVATAVVFSGSDGVRSYRSSADVLVAPIITNPLQPPERADRAVNLDTESRILGSTTVAALVATELGSGDSAEVLAERVTTAASPETQVMSLSFTDTSAATARLGAQAFAEAYLRYRADEARRSIRAVAEGIAARLTNLNIQLSAATVALALNPPESAAFVEAQAARNILTTQTSLLNDQLTTYATLEINPGTIIRPAGPATPVRPRRVPVPLAAAMGLMAGMGVAFGRDRLDDRLHYGPTSRSVAGLPVLAAVPRRRWTQRRAVVPDPDTAEAEAYQRLAANLVAASGRARSTVVVTSPGPGEGKTTVAANLATALARRGRRTALLSADFRRPGLQRCFALPSGPVLNDLLDGLATMDEIGVTPATSSNLTIYPSQAEWKDPGGPPRATAWTAFLAMLRERYDVVVIDGPPVLPVADTLPVAAEATATILVARQHRTSQAAFRDAAAQLDAVGARLAGTVVNRTRPATARDRYYSYSPAGRRAARRRHQLATVTAAGSIVVAVAGAAATPNLPWPGGGRSGQTAAVSPPATVLGATLTRPEDPAQPSTTITTTNPLPPLPVLPFSPVTAPPTTTTTRPPTTTTTTLPVRITSTSATAAAPGVSILLEAAPGDDGRKRSVTLRLTTGFSDARVLRAVRIDYGDGKVVEPSVEPWACNAAGAPNPYVVTAPTRPYKNTGTFVVTATVTTAGCNPDDDDWGPEQTASIQLRLDVP